MFKSFFKKLNVGRATKSPKDPVCGMLATDEITFEYQGQTHAFCSDYCRQQFRDNPGAYVSKSNHENDDATNP